MFYYYNLYTACIQEIDLSENEKSEVVDKQVDMLKSTGLLINCISCNLFIHFTNGFPSIKCVAACIPSKNKTFRSSQHMVKFSLWTMDFALFFFNIGLKHLIFYEAILLCELDYF